MTNGRRLYLSRRSFLVGGASLAAATACGKGDDPSRAADESVGPGKSAGDGATHEGHTGTGGLKGAPGLVPLFNAAGPLIVSGVPQRAPFTIGDENGLANPDAVPGSLAIGLFDEEDKEIVAPIELAARTDGVPIPYFPFRFEVDKPGNYYARATLDGIEISSALAVVEKGKQSAPTIGDTLPRVATPTRDDARGVNPICTREPACEFHAASLDDALDSGKPTVLLVGTPKYCQVHTCGPVLDLLIEQSELLPNLTIIHAEVYESGEAVEKGEPKPSPAMTGLGLDFEPVLYVVGSDGTIVDMLVTVYDRTELKDALSVIA